MALNKQVVIDEAMRLLNEAGMDGVSLRELANRLGVKAPTLYWHVKNKAALNNEMAERLLQPVVRDLQPRGVEQPWQVWLMHLFNQLRQALLAYTDGARVVAGAHFSWTMSDVTEAAIRTLLTAGVSLRESRLIVLTAIHFTLGHVIEEQTPRDAAMISDFDMDRFRREHPTLIAGIEEYFNAGHTAHDVFEDGLKLIIDNR